MISIDAAKARGMASKITRKINTLAAELGKTWNASLALPESEAKKLNWFHFGTTDRGGHQPARPVMQVSGLAKDAILAAIRAKFTEQIRSDTAVNMLIVMTVGANAARRVWIDRLQTSGGDITLAPLSLKYAAMKRRRGLDPRIGVARGTMLAAVKSSRVIVSRLK